ncbi:MAG: hypothetical protein P1U81_19795 [Verrucomicrobiales bacterium]|nr:hypothetical protein [Verrucomicrobiales bacterium]
MKRILIPAVAVLSGIALLSPSPAQEAAISSKDPGQWALLYSDTLQKNRKALMDYSWEYRVEVIEDGSLLYVDRLSANYNAQGVIETTRLDQDLKIKERQGLLFKAGQEKRLAEVEKKIQVLKQLIGRYVYMSRGEVVDFFENARVTEAVGYDNALRVDGENVLTEGDSVTLYGDRATAFPIHLIFSAPYDEKTWIKGEVKFRHLAQLGGFYAPRVSAEFEEKRAVGKTKFLYIDVESHDYVAKP